MAKTGRPIASFPTVPVADVGGVTVGKHTLTAQAEQLASITARIGRRLNHWLRTTPDVVPSGAFLEMYRYYVPALLGLLREQRGRCRVASGWAERATTEELEAQLRHEFLRAAHTFTPEDWAILDRVRAKHPDAGETAAGDLAGRSAPEQPDAALDIQGRRVGS